MSENWEEVWEENGKDKLTERIVMDWVACKDKLPLDHENYLVYSYGQYQVTFYSVRRKKWHVDFEVTHYCKLPKPPCA